MSNKNRTILGFETEEEILSELNTIINRWSSKLQRDSDSIKSSIAYCWADSKREAEESWGAYLSANEIGPYGGR